jgi:hypothetical protein
MMKRYCVACNKECSRTTKGGKTPYCSKECVVIFREKNKVSEPLKCSKCGKDFLAKGYTLSNWRRTGRAYCSVTCGTTVQRATLAAAATHARTNPRFRAEASYRMRYNNPMWMPGNKEKMVASMKGRTFLSRGGNGQHTKHQLMLHLATGLPMEHAIETAAATGVLPSLPYHYKVDLAAPEVKLAIEVDGKSHRLRKWRFLDHRKTTVLNALGWQVLRFTNEQVERETTKCVKTILSTISRLTSTTTISRMGS